jgi:hypothetical protein
MENYIECGLKLLEQVVFYYFNLHVLRKRLVEFVIMQEHIWTTLDILKCMKSVILNNLARNLNSFRQESAYFND